MDTIYNIKQTQKPSTTATIGSMLCAEDISVTYSNGHTAIMDISFALHESSICALVGVNGSGKSTLFKAIMGLIKPSQGYIRVAGMPVKEALKKNLVAYVPQSEDIDWHFPILVYDVVMQGRYGHMNFMRRPSKKDKAAVAEAMARMGIADLAQRQIGELSGGQKKRVFLARALAQQSRIILLDEPFTGVDVKTEVAIMDLLGELKSEGYLMLVSTHNLGSVPDYCSHVVLINRNLIDYGTTADIYTQENLEKTFGGILKNIHLPSSVIHDDDDDRYITILADDERPAVFYGRSKSDSPLRPNNLSDEVERTEVERTEVEKEKAKRIDDKGIDDKRIDKTPVTVIASAHLPEHTSAHISVHTSEHSKKSNQAGKS